MRIEIEWQHCPATGWHELKTSNGKRIGFVAPFEGKFRASYLSMEIVEPFDTLDAAIEAVDLRLGVVEGEPCK